MVENRYAELTEESVYYFKDLGMDTGAPEKQLGAFVKLCLDWTERTFHLGGDLGSASFRWCKEKEYVALDPENRGTRLTVEGNLFLKESKASQ